MSRGKTPQLCAAEHRNCARRGTATVRGGAPQQCAAGEQDLIAAGEHGQEFLKALLS
jgi:hypothetical protein